MQNHSRRALLIACFCVGQLFSASLPAQTVNGSFNGSVVDPGGATIPNADVLITNPSTGQTRETHTGSSGSYVLPDVAPGVYNFTVSSPGFANLTTSGVTLLVNQNASLDFHLKPGSVAQEVTVKAQTVLADTVDATIGTVVDAQQVAQLPLNGRQFTQLTLLTPGAAAQSTGQQHFFEVKSDYGAISPAVNGARAEMNNFTIDGVENNELFFNFAAISPPPDAIAEFKIQTAISSGAFGRAAGANINVVTKSGTNEYHGTLWEFLRNTDLNARNYFAPDRGTFHQNQFGGIAGGPVLKNKLWAFGWYEGFRKVLSSNSFSQIPTATQLGGDFSGYPQLYNPFTTVQTGVDSNGDPIFSRQPFANNQIPQSLLNPAALALIKLLYPASPNNSTPQGNYLNTEPIVTSSNQYGIRLDEAVGEKTTLFGRYTTDSTKKSSPTTLPNFPYDQKQIGTQAVLGMTHTFSPTTVLDLRGQYLRTQVTISSPEPTEAFWTSTGLINDFPGTTDLGSLYPGVSISDATGTANGEANFEGPIRSWEANGTLTKILNNHTLSAGGSFIHTWVLDNCASNALAFDNGATGDPQNPSTTGSGLASYLLGVPASARRQVGSAELKLFGDYESGFVNDVWRAAPKLTVTGSLRYDYASPMQDEHGRIAGVDLFGSTPTNGIYMIDAKAQQAYSIVPLNQIQGSANVDVTRPNSPFLPNRTNWAPRLALAYRASNSLVVRAGYGIFYDFNQSNIQNQQYIMGQYPFGEADSAAINSPTSAAPTPQNILGGTVFPPFVPSLNPPTNPAFAITRNQTRPYLQDWDLGLEKDLGGNLLLSATYVGSKGTHLQTTAEFNDAPTAGPGDPNLRRPLPQFGSLLSLPNVAVSNYAALQLKAEERAAHGLTFIASYTYSKSIDENSTSNGSQQPGELPQNAYDLPGSRGVSDFDLPQNFVFSGVYDLPFGSGKKFLSGSGWLHSKVLGGWQTTGILSLRSGFPFTLSISGDNANIGAANPFQRPSQTGPLLPSGFHRSINEWFDTANLVVIPYTFGNVGRNTLRQGGYKNLDFGVFKNTKLTEKLELQFRAESFNLTNHPNWGVPASTLGSDQFGQVLSASDPRYIQFALKLMY
jgi:hypothetical protein